jgi:ribonuclease D
MPIEELVTGPEALARCCEHLRSCSEIGFDTEFIGEQTFVPQLCLIQVATWERLYLIDPFAAGPLNHFWELIADPRRTVVAHAAREEIRICQRSCSRPPGNLFDLQIAAGLVGLGYPMGHGPLIQKILNVRVNKGETLTDWKIRPLTERQVQYAYDDVRFLLPLWREISTRLQRLGRGEWAREEFAAMIPRSLGEEPGVERWRKLKGLGGLDRRKLGVVRDLFIWREGKALERNRPARTVVRDDLIIEIAKRNPKTEQDLEVVRGLAKKDLSSIVAVVQKARALPPEQLPELTPRDDDPMQVGLVSSMLNCFLGDLCARMELTQALVASANDVKALVRSASQQQKMPESSPFASGWRAQAILPELQAMLEGRRSIRIDSLQREAPFSIEELRINGDSFSSESSGAIVPGSGD